MVNFIAIDAIEIAGHLDGRLCSFIFYVYVPGNAAHEFPQAYLLASYRAGMRKFPSWPIANRNSIFP